MCILYESKIFPVTWRHILGPFIPKWLDNGSLLPRFQRGGWQSLMRFCHSNAFHHHDTRTDIIWRWRWIILFNDGQSWEEENEWHEFPVLNMKCIYTVVTYHPIRIFRSGCENLKLHPYLLNNDRQAGGREWRFILTSSLLIYWRCMFPRA